MSKPAYRAKTVTLAEIATLSGVAPFTVRRHIKRGRLDMDNTLSIALYIVSHYLVMNGD